MGTPSDKEIQDLREAVYPIALQMINALDAFIKRDPNKLTEAIVAGFVDADKHGLLR